MKMTCSQRIEIEIEGKKVDAPLLTWTSAMDCWSWSLPALISCPSAFLETEDSICRGCYALINRYAYESTFKAQNIRLEWTKKCLSESPELWISTMINTIKSHATNGYFRIHDSGDFLSPEYVKMWIHVCRHLNHIKFWAPTRSWRPGTEVWIAPLAKLQSLPNVSVNPSALKIDDIPPNIKYLASGSGVCSLEKSKELNNVCPKSLNGGSCSLNNCRSCWDGHEVNFLLHGYSNSHSSPNIKASNILAKAEKEKKLFNTDHYSKYAKHFKEV